MAKYGRLIGHRDPVMAPRPHHIDARNPVQMMQERQEAAKARAVEHLRLAHRISAAIGTAHARGTASGASS